MLPLWYMCFVYFALDAFSERWDKKYLKISRFWRDNWDNFNFSQDVRWLIYTTNTIEGFRASNKTCKEVNDMLKY